MEAHYYLIHVETYTNITSLIQYITIKFTLEKDNTHFIQNEFLFQKIFFVNSRLFFNN